MDGNSVIKNINSISPKTFGNISKSLDENKALLEDSFSGSFDIVIRNEKCGTKEFMFVFCDGLCDSLLISTCVVRPVINCRGPFPRNDTIGYLTGNVINCGELKTERNLDRALRSMLSGCTLVFVNDEDRCIVCSTQKIPVRSIDEPYTEVEEKGSREGLTESIKMNTALLRKRMATPELKIDTLRLGLTSNTRAAICYISGKVDEDLLEQVRGRICKVKLDTVFGAFYMRSFLDTGIRSLFTMVGSTERPDVLCAKLNEGKVALLVDGTPFALFVPFLFIENFQTMDDYLNRPFFASLIRILRIVCFLFSVLLPGFYVAMGLFHQELLPDDMLYSIVMAESNTMFPLVMEALIIHFIYEVVREAGLRMPKSVGHAVSIVGALVIGDAAVTAGLIGAPMLIVVALTAISSFVVSNLYQPISVLRFIFILLGGVSGLYGIMIGVGLLLVNMCAVTNCGVAYLSPFVPFNRGAMRDTVTRPSFVKMARGVFNISGLRKGSGNGK